jgi:4-hydroxy-tetrahydrodipicolinate reductase
MKIGVLGCTGRVGSLIVTELLSGHWPSLTLAGGTARDASKIKGDYFITPSAEELFHESDALIDFTRPEATREHAGLAAKTGKILIVGTTGLSLDDETALEKAAHSAPIVYAANMSVGVNLLLALVEKAAAALAPDHWDIEIFESHHKHKVDAPSGTALAIGRAAAKGRSVVHDNVAVRARDGITGEREEGTIGYSIARGGDVVGEHTAFFYGAGERIELTHIATNRALFAKGALKAALWAKGRKPGLYSMRDVLGL